MIYDCFPFFNELDVLEIRLSLLYDHVDKFILVEAKQTYSYKDKPLYYEENKQRFARFHDKIEHLIVEKFPESKDPWIPERLQRDSMIDSLKNCCDDDIIIVSDVDEIPDPVLFKRNIDKLYHIEMPFYYFYLNYEVNQMWNKSYISPFRDIKGNSLTTLRMSIAPEIPYKGEFSFHVSFLFGNDYEKYIHKTKSFAHHEYNRPTICNINHVRCCLKYGIDMFMRPDYSLKYKKNKALIKNPAFAKYKQYYLKRNIFSLIPTIGDLKAFWGIYMFKNYPFTNPDNPFLNTLKYVLKDKITKAFSHKK